MRRILIRLVLAVAVLAPTVAVALWWRGHLAGDVRTHKITAGRVMTGVTVSGTIRCKRRLAIASEVIAAVKSLPVDEGRKVTTGQVLVVLDDSVNAAECAKARSRVELARQQLAESKAGPRKEEITKANEALLRADADIRYATKEHDRLLAARRGNVATESELNLSANRLQKAKHEQAWAKAHLDLLRAGTRKEQLARARAEVLLAEADLQGCQALSRKYTLRAPHDGVVTVRYVNVGEVVSPGQALLRVEDIESIEIRAQIQESQLQGVRRGSRARVLADAYPDRPLNAVVQQILPRVDPEQGSITALLKLSEPPPVALMDGMAADIAIIEQEKENILRVPAAAIEQQGDQATVQVQQGGGFVRRTITTGVSDGHWVEVKSGLKIDDVVRLP